MELSPELVTTLVTLLTFVVVLILLLRRGSPLDATTLSAAVAETINYGPDLTEIALQGVRSAEQLARTGKITRDERFLHAFEHVRQFYPDLDIEATTNAIESAVLVTKALVANLPPVVEALTGVGSTNSGSVGSYAAQRAASGTGGVP